MEQVDLSLLPALDALLHAEGVTGAAERLGLSKPAVSYRLGRLRDEMGDPLLVRSGRGMVLTPYAEGIKQRVHTLHEEARQLLLEKEPLELGELERSFSIRCTDYVLTLLGNRLDQTVGDQAPGVRLRFIPNARDDVLALEQGDADLAVGIYGDLPPNLRSRLLLTDRHMVAVRRGHPEVKKRLTLAKYESLPHIQIAPRGTPGGYIDDQLAAQGRQRRVMRAVPYFHSALELVSHTDYLLTVSERIAAPRLRELKLRLHPLPFENEPYALSLLWHPRYDGDRAHQFLREALIDCAESVASDRHSSPRRRLRR